MLTTGKRQARPPSRCGRLMKVCSPLLRPGTSVSFAARRSIGLPPLLGWQWLRAQGGVVLHHARDLGGHLRSATSSTVVHRIQAMDDLWPKLCTSHAGYEAKLRAVKCAWPRAFYGISICHLGQRYITGLRLLCGAWAWLAQRPIRPCIWHWWRLHHDNRGEAAFALAVQVD